MGECIKRAGRLTTTVVTPSPSSVRETNGSTQTAPTMKRVRRPGGGRTAHISITNISAAVLVKGGANLPGSRDCRTIRGVLGAVEERVQLGKALGRRGGAVLLEASLERVL